MGREAMDLRERLAHEAVRPVTQPSDGALRTMRGLHSPTALVSLGREPALAAANPAFVAALGVDERALTGHHPLFWVEAQCASTLRAGFDAAAQAGEEWNDTVLSLATGSGKTRCFLLALLPLFTDSGPATHALLRLSPARTPAIGATPGERASAVRRRPFIVDDGALREASQEAERARGEAERAETARREGHVRVMKALRLLSAMMNREAPMVRDKRGRAALARLRERAGAMSHILDVLHRTQAPRESLLARQIQTLSEELRDCMAPDGHPPPVEIRVQAETLPWEPEKIVTLLVIVHELVGNALRHAFPAGMSGAIDIRLYKVDDIVRLYVEDDGCGLSSDAFVKDTFGLNMVEAIVRHASGTIGFSGNYGTQAMIRLPL